MKLDIAEISRDVKMLTGFANDPVRSSPQAAPQHFHTKMEVSPAHATAMVASPYVRGVSSSGVVSQADDVVPLPPYHSNFERQESAQPSVRRAVQVDGRLHGTPLAPLRADGMQAEIWRPMTLVEWNSPPALRFPPASASSQEANAGGTKGRVAGVGPQPIH